jgi:subtilase family serine protease
VVAKPDLVVTTVGNPPAVVSPTASFTANDTVVNAGAYPSTSSSTRYYLSADETKGPTDTLLSGARSVPALQPDGMSQGGKTVTVPSSTPLGTYWLIACADDLRKVAELDEGNNCRTSATTVRVGRPDLVTSSVGNPPLAVAPGTSLSISAATHNQGDAPAAASTTRYYLSADDVKSAGDILLSGSRSVAALAPGATSTGAKIVTVPASTAAGRYHLLACSDDLAKVVEHDETNNCRAAASTIDVRLPDLLEIAVSDPPADIVAGASIAITDTVRNDGEIASPSTSTRYYLSVDGVKDAGDILLTGARSVGALAAGASNTGSRSVTVPTNTTPGLYHVLACADQANTAVESNEGNNCVVSTGRVTVR